MTTRYGIKEYLKEYKEALEEQPEQAKPQGKPNVLQMMWAKKENKEPQRPLV